MLLDPFDPFVLLPLMLTMLEFGCRTIRLRLFQAAGGRLNLMHCKWLGTDAYLLGSALAVLFKFKYNQDLDNLLDDLSRLLFCRFSCACCSKVAVGCSEFLATPTCWDGLMF